MMLKGKIIINTRHEGSDDRIGEALKELGATVLSMPLIEIETKKIAPKVLVEIENNTYQWLVFTSKNGVDQFFGQLKLPGNMSTLSFKIAVFGERTAMTLNEHGFTPDIVCRGNTSGDLLDDLKAKLRPDDRVLLVLGELAADLLQDGLKSSVKVDRLNVYRTVYVEAIDPEILGTIAMNKYDLILFVSPSGYRSFKHHTKLIISLNKLKIACIGPTTEKALLADGIIPLLVAKPSGKKGMIKEIKKYFATPSMQKI